jgi:hypothetical protein
MRRKQLDTRQVEDRRIDLATMPCKASNRSDKQLFASIQLSAVRAMALCRRVVEKLKQASGGDINNQRRGREAKGEVYEAVGLSLVNAQTRATIQPMSVQPSKRLTALIAVLLRCLRLSATMLGAKYTTNNTKIDIQPMAIDILPSLFNKYNIYFCNFQGVMNG